MAEEKLDLLDLDDEIDLPELPEDGALACGRPHRPWFLFGAALIVIVLATYIIVRIVMHGAKNDSVEIDLNTPPPPPATEQAATPPPPPATDFAAGADKVIAGQAPQAGVPVRVVEERKDVVFKPDAPSAAPVKVAPKIEPPKPRPITKSARASAKTIAPTKPVVERHETTSSSNGFYVQFGSYATRSGAEVSQRKLQATHASLFTGYNFVIQEALLPNGKTTYRLRISFTNSQEADGFCRNAKSDGLDCYVAR